MTSKEFLALTDNKVEQFKHLKNLAFGWRKAATSFRKLTDKQKALALEGIERHHNACIVCELEITLSACTEIINDAKDYRQIWKESDKDFVRKLEKE